MERYEWSGHVYNLETVDGWYTANRTVVHNCNCSQARKWGRPYVLGEERFARLSEEAQIRILGPARYRAFRLGEIKLTDCVVETRFKGGKGRRLATLAELGIS